MTFFKDFKNSFFNFKEYKTFMSGSYGKAMGYAALVSVIFALLFTIKMGIFLNTGIDEFINV